MNGILNINKPEGMTSYDVIRVIKRVSGERKIGHTGTLDPLAKGVLPLFLGKLTKLIPFFNADDKEYVVTARLGYRSTTIDREGEISKVSIPEGCDQHAVKEHLKSFIGDIEQIPPLYSAVKVGGKRLYEYARKGENVERQPRSVVIFDISEIESEFPDVSFKVHCSKGTYVRSLVRDLGKALGTAAYMTDLTRTRSGESFFLKDSIALDQIKNLNKIDLQKILIDPQYLLPDWHIVTASSDKHSSYISQGRALRVTSGEILISPKGKSEQHALVKDRFNKTIAAGRLEFSQDDSALFHPFNVFL